MKALILAGGSGTRLWPLSRNSYPKQFIKIDGKESFLQKSVKRNLRLVTPENLFIITGSHYYHDVLRQIQEIEPALEQNIILEPLRRNTAPAIALAARYILEKSGDDLLFVSPSDHLISPLDQFVEIIQASSLEANNGSLVTFGVRPSRPETGFGYLRVDRSPCEGKSVKVKAFIEKPTKEKAREYLEEGNHFWNSGMFTFKLSRFFEELKIYDPTISTLIETGFEEAYHHFEKMPDISIDYALMEKSKHVQMFPLDLNWSDVGSWENVYEMLPKDAQGNASLGETIAVETKNSLLVSSPKRLVVTLGLEDALVVATEDVVLIGKKSDAQRVKELVGKLKAQGRKEIDENTISNRPWGSFTVLEEGTRYKIKKILVLPLQKLSLQMHYHRSEHWVVVKGTATVTIGEHSSLVHEGESIFVPKSAIHRVENRGKVPLEIIEVQVGEYLGEDDIVRLDDVYGRLNEASI